MTRSFSLEQALRARGALRHRLLADEESFSIEAMIGMVSDEIEQLRDAGVGDGEIAKLISTSAGSIVSAKDIADHYAPPERRRRD